MRLKISFLFQNKLLVSCPLCVKGGVLWCFLAACGNNLSSALSLSFFPSSVTSWKKNIKLLHFSLIFNLIIKSYFFLGNKFFLKSVAVPDFPAFYTNWYFPILLILLSFLGVCSRPFWMSYFNLWVYFFVFFFQNFSVPEDLSAYDGLELRLKGDGRRYKLIIRTSSDWDTVGYTASFDTVAGQWQSVSDI